MQLERFPKVDLDETIFYVKYLSFILKNKTFPIAGMQESKIITNTL